VLVLINVHSFENTGTGLVRGPINGRLAGNSFLVNIERM
jgi:hypothetical protein